MTELRIDAGKAERIITQILRDEKGIPPADAVAVAASICRRLTTAMPTSPSLDRYRIISREPPDGDGFALVARVVLEPHVPLDVRSFLVRAAREDDSHRACQLRRRLRLRDARGHEHEQKSWDEEQVSQRVLPSIPTAAGTES